MSRARWISVFVVPPAVVAVVAVGSIAHLYVAEMTDYVVAYTLAAILWIPSALLSTVPNASQKVIPAFKGMARGHTARFRFWSKSKD